MFDFNLYFFCENKSEKIIRNFLAKYNADSGRCLCDEVEVYRSEEGFLQNKPSDEWVKVNDTESWIKLGLSEQSISFAIDYSLPEQPVNGLIIAFTLDGGVIFGINIEENDKNFEYSKRLLVSFKEEIGAALAAVFVEEPPPVSKDRFIETINNQALFKA
jgi:hypothetical protein